MVHVSNISPSLGNGLPKSPSFHQGLAYMAVAQQNSNKVFPMISNMRFQDEIQPQPFLIGKTNFAKQMFFNLEQKKLRKISCQRVVLRNREKVLEICFCFGLILNLVVFFSDSRSEREARAVHPKTATMLCAVRFRERSFVGPEMEGSEKVGAHGNGGVREQKQGRHNRADICRSGEHGKTHTRSRQSLCCINYKLVMTCFLILFFLQTARKESLQFIYIIVGILYSQFIDFFFMYDSDKLLVVLLLVAPL